MTRPPATMEGTARAAGPDAARRFRTRLAVVVAVAAAVRVLYILLERAGTDLHAAVGVVGGDAWYYHEAARLLPDRGFVSPEELLILGRAEPAAHHPPLYVLWLAIPAFLDVWSPVAQMLWSAVLGVATVALVGLLGREIAGDRVGLVAAGLAALYPNVWSHDGFLTSETMAVFTVTLTLLLAYRFRSRPTVGRAAALGFGAALATLSRAELALLFLLVVLPLVAGRREQPARERVKRLVAAGAVAAVPMAPWVGANMVRFEHPAYLSTGFGVTLLSASCDETFYGTYTGYWSMDCAQAVRDAEVPPELDQTEEEVIFRREALDYIGDHLDRLPAVVLARWGRITGLWRPGQQVELDFFPEGRERWVARLALGMWYPIAALAVVGAVLLRRRRVPVYPLAALPLTVLVTVGIMFATNRYRATAETALCVLAAVAIDAFLARRERRAPSAGAPHATPASASAGAAPGTTYS